MSTEPSEAEQTALHQVRSGFWSLTEIISNIVQVLEDEDEQAQNQTATRPSPRQRRRQSANDDVSIRASSSRTGDGQRLDQEHWPETTEVDSGARAFDSLERNHKITARMNVGCCRTCGIAELNEYYLVGISSRQSVRLQAAVLAGDAHEN